MSDVTIAYRDHDRTPLLYLIRDMAARHEGLEVGIQHVAGQDEYEQGFLRGDLEIICEHLRFLYPARLEGHPVRCLAACQNWSNELLLARDRIATLSDLAGQTVAVRATPSSRITASFWLRHLGLEGRTEQLVVDDAEVGRWQQWRKVSAGQASAVVCSPLYAGAALDAGLRQLHAPPLPEIGSLFFAALGPFVQTHEDELRRLMRALYRALCAFHRQPDLALACMSDEPARLMGLDEPMVRSHYQRLEASYDRKPIPRPEALANTFAILNEGYARLDGLNPLTLWDLRFIIELEEERFMEHLEEDRSWTT